MTTITCPECGLQAQFDSMRRNAEEFCERCDFPLFWARSDAPLVMASNGADTTRRRLPGTGGRVTVGSRLCPECGELNPLGETHCIRCTADLDPPPPPEPVVEVYVEPPPPPPEPEPVKRRWWPWVVLAVAVILLAVVLIVRLT